MHIRQWRASSCAHDGVNDDGTHTHRCDHRPHAHARSLAANAIFSSASEFIFLQLCFAPARHGRGCMKWLAIRYCRKAHSPCAKNYLWTGTYLQICIVAVGDGVTSMRKWGKTMCANRNVWTSEWWRIERDLHEIDTVDTIPNRLVWKILEFSSRLGPY